MIGERDLIAYMSTAEGQKEFTEFRDSTIFRLLVAASRERARPRRAESPIDIQVAQMHGESIGANSIIDFFEDPVNTKRSGSLSGLAPSYGAAAILEEEGRNAE